MQLLHTRLFIRKCSQYLGISTVTPVTANERPMANISLIGTVAHMANTVDALKMGEGETTGMATNGAGDSVAGEGDKQVTVEGVVSSHAQSEELY